MADKKTDDVLTLAKERFERALESNAHNRDKAKGDIRFAAASPDDPWQWDELDVQSRKLAMRPMLTINKQPQHIRQVTNDIRQNRPSIRYRPADSGADVEVAEILMGLVRHIEANSDADIAYDTASEHQVTHGLGYIRVMADYISEESFDQDIFIKRVKDPFKCYDDPEAKDPAGADRKWFFIEETIGEKEFQELYPKADAIDWTFARGNNWFGADKSIRLVEYYEVKDTDAELQQWANGSTSFKGEKLPVGVIPGEAPVNTRKSKKRSIIWRKLNGQQILEERTFPGKLIPFARVLGNEWEVDGKTYISGIVRNAKDSQRMYNVAQSAIVERIMQAPKAPWLAAADAVTGHEKAWQTANTANHSFLPWNHLDEEGNAIPAPSRVSPATVETGLNQIAMGAADDIKSETGQYDASLGQRSNETSGRAIMARQREGDNATFHYVDNLGRAIRHIGRIVLGMIPTIYETKRFARILGEDGEASGATIDPEMPEPLREEKDDEGAIQRIFNPNVGTYDVHTTSGPSFNTRRLEALDAMTAMTQANPELWRVIGDQLVKSMDWPGAEDMAKRLKLTLLPEVQASIDNEAQEELPPSVKQAMDQMQGQIKEFETALNNAASEVDKLEKEKAESAADLEIKRVEANTKAYQAITQRLQVLGPLLKPEEAQALAEETRREAMEQPDPARPPSESMGIPEDAEVTKNPPSAVFFTPGEIGSTES